MKATIVIQDEVNCKINGLGVSTRNKIVNKFKFEVPGARYLPSVKLGRWDGKISFATIGGGTYINLLPDILPILIEDGYEIELNDLRDYQVDFQFDTFTKDSFSHVKWPKGHPLEGQPITFRDDQVEVINTYLSNTQSIQELSTSFGKCQPYYSKILTPSGWTTMGEISRGDIVLTPTGKSVSVLETYEPGIKDVYELTFTDGRKVRACGDHIWKVGCSEWNGTRTNKEFWRHHTTTELIELHKKARRPIGVPLVTMEHDNVDKCLPIDPWLMGVILGDGGISVTDRLIISSADDEIVSRIESTLHSDYKLKHCGNYDYRIMFRDVALKNSNHSTLLKNKKYSNGKNQSSNSYIQSLFDMELMGLKSHEKFIPEIYFSGSLEQRLELIRGLVDSDGYVNNKSVIEFGTTSEKLAKDFQRLIHSVGAKAQIKKHTDRTYVYKNERKSCRDVYRVYVYYAHNDKFTWLSRKKEKVIQKRRDEFTYRLNIVSIELVSTEPVKCIMIDDPQHLYITDDYVVTHNTVVTSALSKNVEKYGRSIIIVPSKSLVTQTEADYINMGLDVGVYFGDRKDVGKTHTICTWQSLAALMKNTKANKGDITIHEFLEDVVCVIGDECHTIKGTLLREMLCSVMAKIPIRWGLTGTIPKEMHEQICLRISIGEVVGKVTASELQEAGFLSKCHIHIKQLVDHVEYKEYKDELRYLLETQERLEHIADMIAKISETGNTLVLIDRVEPGQILAGLIDGATFISGSAKAKKRKEEFDNINENDNQILIATYGIASTGINIPRIFNLVLIEPGKSFVRVIQSIGRGIRKAKDKDSVEIYDITSTCKFAKRHLTARKSFYKDAKYPFTLEKINWN